MKKRILSVVVALVLMLSMLPGIGAAAQQDVKVVLFGQMLQFDVPPQLINGRTMVPLRVIFESIGATVGWDDTTQTVTSTKDATTVSLTIGVPSITVNGNVIALDTAPCVIDGRTLVPARAVSEAFGLKVDWDDWSWTVYITEPVEEPAPEPTPAPVPQTAFDRLKNYVLQNGELSEGSYHVFYTPDFDSDSKVSMLTSYDPAENVLSCYLNLESGKGSDASETSGMIALYENQSNGVVFNFGTMGMSFQIIGMYTTPNAPYVELKNTFPTSELQASGRGLLDSFLSLMDTMLQSEAGISIREFGIYYVD